MRAAACLSVVALGLIAGDATAQEVDRSRGAEPLAMIDWAKSIQQEYPSEALLAQEAGTVVMKIRINAEGRVSECSVTQSSQSAALDAAACRGMQAYARYRPALDANGQPVETGTTQAIRYVLPKIETHLNHPVPVNERNWRAIVFDKSFDVALKEAANDEVVFQLVTDEGGKPAGCGMNVSSGNAELDRHGCAGLLKHAKFQPATLLDGTAIPGSYWVGYTPDTNH